MQNLSGLDLKSLVAKNDCFESAIQENICTLFQNEVKRHPGRIAAIFEDHQLTYQELDEKSTILAHYLISEGVGPESIVGLSVGCDFNLLIGVLAILKAGGVYFPLDPNYPKERLRFMLADANPILLLTHSNLADRFCDYKNRIIHLEEIDWSKISLNSANLSPRCMRTPKPEDLAYLIYTSGSTGKPKGIMITYKSFPHFSTTHKEYYPSEMVSLVTGSISFDISTLTIFHSLISGGTICLLKSVSAVDCDEIIHLINKNFVNHLLCVPSLYSILMEKSQQLPSLKTVSLAGENIPRDLPALHAQFAPNAILYNEYAPSECACGATIAKIYDPIEQKIHPITIGKPLPNTEIYLLDTKLYPVSPGSKGEIFIGGMGLAQGYLNKLELTSERFVSVSLEGGKKVRLYQTGDYGRYLSDGNLEFLGRIDHQIKIRGYRIELAEVEYAMCQYEGIKEAVVVVQEDIHSNKRLIGYFSADSQTQIHLSLREYLQQILPAPMIPSVLMQVEGFFRTENGKIDRRVLPDVFEHNKGINKISKIQSELEEALSDIWKKVLHLDAVGMEQNFFDLGGDSLSIARVQTFIDTDLGINIPIVDLLEYPTIFQLSQNLYRQNKDEIIPLNKCLSDKKKAAFQRFKSRAGR